MEVTVTETLFELIEQKKFKKVQEILIEMNESDVADFISELEPEKTLVIFRTLPKDLTSDVFAYLDIDKQHELIQSISDKEISRIMEDLSMDDAVDMIEELPANIVKRVMQNTSPKTRNLINIYLKFPENSAGTIMTAEYVAFKKSMTVEDAISYIRKNEMDKETIYTCYVTNAKRKLEGVVSLKDLVLASPNTIIEDIMDTNVIKAVTTDDREEVVATFNKYDLIALPIVDKEDRLVGIVTVDDAVDVMEEEATEDVERMAAIMPSEKPYLKTGIFETWKQRIPWLLFLMISAAFTGGIISMYEEALGRFVILTSFIPMLMGTGGNAGGQSSVTIIRGLSLGEIEFKDMFTVMWKELRVALLCGITLALTNLIKLMVIDHVTMEVGLVVCSTLVVTVVIAKLIGCTLPLIAEKVKLDPAVMASPFITTIVDALSLVVYFQIATQILHI